MIRPSSDGHVTHLGVAHLAFGQTHRGAGGGEQAVRAGGGQAVPHRRFRQRDGVVLRLRPMAPPIQHAENDGAAASLPSHDPAF